jgi:hypothetical protein
LIVYPILSRKEVILAISADTYFMFPHSYLTKHGCNVFGNLLKRAAVKVFNRGIYDMDFSSSPLNNCFSVPPPGGGGGWGWIGLGGCEV